MSTITTRRGLLKTTAGLAAAAGLAGCGMGDSGTTGGRTRTIEHAMGRTEVPVNPSRIITLDDTFTSAALALQSNVIGYTTSDATSTTLPAYLGEDAKTHGGQARWVGTLSDPNIEQITRLRPDLILSAKVRHEQLYSQLSAVAPTVFSAKTGASWKANLRMAGSALGKGSAAEDVLGHYRRRARTIGDDIRTTLGHNPTMSIVRFAGEPTVRLYTANSFAGIVQADTGLARPQGQPTSDAIAVKLSQERILDLDAEHIFISAYQDVSGDAGKARRAFQANPLWSQLKGQKHVVNDTTWMTAVGPHGAHHVLDDLAHSFRVDPAQ